MQWTGLDSSVISQTGSRSRLVQADRFREPGNSLILLTTQNMGVHGGSHRCVLVTQTVSDNMQRLTSLQQQRGVSVPGVMQTHLGRHTLPVSQPGPMLAD